MYCRLPARFYVQFVIHSVHHSHNCRDVLSRLKDKTKEWKKSDRIEISRTLLTFHSINGLFVPMKSNCYHSNALGVCLIVAPLLYRFRCPSDWLCATKENYLNQYFTVHFTYLSLQATHSLKIFVCNICNVFRDSLGLWSNRAVLPICNQLSYIRWKIFIGL